MTPNRSNTAILGDGTGDLFTRPESEEEAPVRLPGYHANTVEGVMAANPHLEARRVEPSTILIPIFGAETVCLWWEDKAVMVEELGPGLAAPAEPAP